MWNMLQVREIVRISSALQKNCRLEEEKLQSFDDQNELQGDFVSKVDFVIPWTVVLSGLRPWRWGCPRMPRSRLRSPARQQRRSQTLIGKLILKIARKSQNGHMCHCLRKLHMYIAVFELEAASLVWFVRLSRQNRNLSFHHRSSEQGPNFVIPGGWYSRRRSEDVIRFLEVWSGSDSRRRDPMNFQRKELQNSAPNV